MSPNAHLRFILLSVAIALSQILLSCSASEDLTLNKPSVELSLKPLLASTDLSLGKNRLVFGLLDSRNTPVISTGATMELFYSDESEIIGKGKVSARLTSWPTALGGVFVANIDFDAAGAWFAEISPEDGDSSGELGRLNLIVSETPKTPSIGSQAPASLSHKSLQDSSLSKLTSDPEPDPGLYSVSINEAIKSGKPSLIAFVTPSFCKTATCGPQLEVIKMLRTSYKNQAHLIHAEIYSNPEKISSGIETASLSPTVKEWNLPSEPWVFVIDSGGRISGKFEGYASFEEISEQLQKVI